MSRVGHSLVRIAALACGLALAGCGSVSDHQRAPAAPHYKIGKPYKIYGKWYYPALVTSYRAVGVASWYGGPYHGRRTANGEVFDMNALTAAHPTLPLPSLVRVTNFENGRSLVLRVNDRGPFVKDREIDLSRAAAQALGFERQGLARVQVAWLGFARLEDAIVALGHPPRRWDDAPTVVLAQHEVCAPVPRHVWVC